MISEESLEKFKELYKKEFGEEKSNSSRELFFLYRYVKVYIAK